MRDWRSAVCSSVLNRALPGRFSRHPAGKRLKLAEDFVCRQAGTLERLIAQSEALRDLFSKIRVGPCREERLDQLFPPPALPEQPGRILRQRIDRKSVV